MKINVVLNNLGKHVYDESALSKSDKNEDSIKLFLRSTRCIRCEGNFFSFLLSATIPAII